MDLEALVKELKINLQNEIDFLHYETGNTLEDKYMHQAIGREKAFRDILKDIIRLEEIYKK